MTTAATTRSQRTTPAISHQFRLVAWLALALAALIGLPATAQVAKDPFAQAVAVAPIGADGPVTVSATPASTIVAPGGLVAIAISLEFESGWHIYTNNVPTPEALGGVLAIPTEVFGEFEPIDGYDSDIEPLAVQWPEPKPFEIQLDPSAPPATVPVFGGSGGKPTVIYLAGRVPAGVPVGSTLELFIDVSFQACDDAQCLPPDGWSGTVSFEVAEDAADLDTSGVFADLDVSAIGAAPAGTDAGANPGDRTSSAGTATPDQQARTFFGIAIPTGEGAAGIAVLAGLAALGGLILNLTPCVLPVIPIKVMTISQHAGTPGKSAVLGLAMALGVVAFWAAIGLPVAFVTGITDPSRVFGYWYVTFGIGLVIAAMGVGIMGLFSINLPKQVYMVNPKADSIPGSFMFGVMTAVLGLPCFGFVAGALLAGAATLPASTIMIIFTALGVGMALPYLVLSAFPKLVDKLPRTGPASELVKQVMGLLLLAAAAYFIGSGLIGLVSEAPYLGKQLHWWAIATLAGLAGLWLAVRTFQISKSPAPRAIFTIVGVVIGAVAVLYAMDTTGKARDAYELRRAAKAEQAATGELLTTTWIDYDEASYQRALDSGKVVVRDFTAEWCLNCKALKAQVLNREPVKSQLAGADVISFTVDLTSRKAPGWDALDALNEVGIPLLTVEGPGLDGVWKSNAYTSEQVLDALGRARGGSASARPAGSPQTAVARD